VAGPFLDVDGFTAEYQGALAVGEVTTVTRLLQVVSDWIRGKKPDVNEDAAKQVVFEVVRDAVMYGALEKLSSFQNITSRRQESGTFDEAAKVVDDYLTDRHKRLLGIPLRAAPRGRFKKCDY
jgi:hypothetical protein